MFCAEREKSIQFPGESWKNLSLTRFKIIGLTYWILKIRLRVLDADVPPKAASWGDIFNLNGSFFLEYFCLDKYTDRRYTLGLLIIMIEI